MVEGRQMGFAKQAVYWLVIILITFAISKFFIDRFPWDDPNSTLDTLMNGTAPRPYVYRMFIPLLIRMAVFVLPLPATIYASLLIYFSLLGFAISIHSFSVLYWKSDMAVDFVGAISLIMLLPLTLWNEHVYDFATLLLFSLALMFMAQARWRLFFLVYTLGCLNKETTVFLSLIFFVAFWHRARDSFFWKLLGGQLAVYTVIRLIIMWSFQNNPGGIIENHFADHIAALHMAPALVLTHMVFGIVLILLAAWNWRKKPFFLRKAAIVLVPVLFVLYLLGGYPLEIRVFYEAYPIILLLILPAFSKIPGLAFLAAQNINAAGPEALSLYPDKIKG